MSAYIWNQKRGKGRARQGGWKMGPRLLFLFISSLWRLKSPKYWHDFILNRITYLWQNHGSQICRWIFRQNWLTVRRGQRKDIICHCPPVLETLSSSAPPASSACRLLRADYCWQNRRHSRSPRLPSLWPLSLQARVGTVPSQPKPTLEKAHRAQCRCCLFQLGLKNLSHSQPVTSR